MSDGVEIQVISAAAIKYAFLELASAFEQATANKVVVKWVSTPQIMNRLKGGETLDVVVMETVRIDELIELGILTAGTRVDLAKSTVGAAVRQGAARPDISSAAALKAALLAAKSIVYSGGPSGRHLLRLVERMGIAEELKSKLQQAQGEPTGVVVARGDAELAFQQVCELLPVSGIDFLGPLPAEVQHTTVLSAGVHVRAEHSQAARALVQFMTAPTSGPVFRKHGLDPA